LKPALAEQARAMAARFDFWGVGDMPEGYQTPSGTDDPLNSMDHFEFGAAMRHGLEITGKIHARSAPDAEKMGRSMNQFQAMVKWQQREANGTKMDLQSVNGTIQIRIQVSEEDLKKAVEARMAAGMAEPKAKAVPPPPCQSNAVVVCLPGAK